MDCESSRYDKLEGILQDQSAEPCDIPLQYLRDITNNFSAERELGKGGFGVVYKGVLPNGAMVAVKNLVSFTEVEGKQFKNEVDNLTRARHQNIIRFLGYCYETWLKHLEYNGNYVFAERPQRLLCFEYMPNGSLDRYISEESHGLDWHRRYKIIKGICCGLHYLHEEYPNKASIIHLDLKPANILLDDNMVPKIADFGLSKLLDDKKTRTRATTPGGTLGYMAPEYLFQGIITTKADIYSLGVVIIEMISGHKISPYDTGTSCGDFVALVLKNWRKRLEASARFTKETEYQQIEICLEIGLSCVRFEPMERPAARQIVDKLNRRESTHICVSNEEIPPADQNANGGCEDRTIKSIVSDLAVQSSQSPSGRPLEFKKEHQEIIELWHACDVSLVHRTYFFLLFFMGDQASATYVNVELRRLLFIRDSHSRGSTPGSAGAGSLQSSPDERAKELRRERETLARLMQKRLTAEQRKRLYAQWGVPPESENRKLQVARRLWTETGDLEHVRESASLIAKLVGFHERAQGHGIKEMFRAP